MRLLPRTVAYRVGIISAAAFAGAIAVIGIAVLFAVHNAFIRQLDESIEQAQVSLVGEFKDEGLDGLAEEIAMREASASSALGFAVFTADGARVAGRLDAALPAPGWSRISFRDPEEGDDPARALTTRLSDGSYLLVAADLEPVEQMDGKIVAVFGIAFAFVLAIGAFFAAGLGRYLKRRLDAIAKGSRAFASGEYKGRAEVGDRGDEFDQLASSLNAMLERIETLLTNLRQVTSDLAHDMRTPLTRLRNDLDDLRSAPSGERDDRIDLIAERCDDILRLFSAILRISELEEGDARRHFAPVELNALARDIADAHEPLAEESGNTLSVELSPTPVVLQGDRDLLAQAMINLVENALRHSPPGGDVTVAVLDHEEYRALQVRDRGPGIAPADRERVTDRFVRLETARTSPGHGLGLALVKAIAEAHGGKLVLEDGSPGLDARMVFPAGGTA